MSPKGSSTSEKRESSGVKTSSQHQQLSPQLGESQRLVCLDALRGFDMFWIAGAEEIVHALPNKSHSPVLNFFRQQLTHIEWAGFRFYDLIFPMFVFMVGVAIVFSLPKAIERGGRPAALRRILQRAILLFVLGIFYNGGLSGGLDKMRLLGVLQRISLCYLTASLLFCFLRLRGLVIACVSLLVGYWALMTFVPVPGLGAGHFEKGKNLANYIDTRFLPFRRYDGGWDPEGILSTLPAVASCLFGVFSGMLVKNASVGGQKKVFWLVGAGALSVVLGYLWGYQFPVVKRIWTSSFVLVAGGYSAILLGVFYQVTEVWKLRLWAQPFVWIGVNPITVYLAHSIVSFPDVAERIVGGPIKGAFGQWGDLLVALTGMALTFALVRFLYQRKIFIRV